MICLGVVIVDPWTVKVHLGLSKVVPGAVKVCMGLVTVGLRAVKMYLELVMVDSWTVKDTSWACHGGPLGSKGLCTNLY